ncbi:MAG: TauD/TfdA family dioxygenase [Bacteroidota bacterium]
MNINNRITRIPFDRLEPINGVKMMFNVSEDPDFMLGWPEVYREEIDTHLSTHGALLIRGVNIQEEQFGETLSSLFGEELISYTYRSTPRTELGKKVYTATEFPSSESIPQHNEKSYSNVWPLRIGFLCVQPASKQGNTPISDSRSIYKKIPIEIREEFERKKIMYVRNYSNIDLPWQEVFQTQEKKEVEAYCVANNIKWEWTERGLRTKQINNASLYHPVTNEKVWFNQAHLFHVSSLDEELKESLLMMLGEEYLPRNTYFGDGSPIDESGLAEIRKIYEETKFSFDWEQNDLLLLDNMLYTHGREPFEGSRKILVGMARTYTE